ncbi:hypothetical protein F4558_005205 [Micromonospora profundi]|uniref:hypothetical protein n=1 Tax=Micromonospora profundi TaxID=1420889 RepID=UPI0014390E10|nr:hypothetical protein [Micromonospora profundi]NJC15379.1 hypothetical protein [Micromonospora profundi]
MLVGTAVGVTGSVAVGVTGSVAVGVTGSVGVGLGVGVGVGSGSGGPVGDGTGDGLGGRAAGGVLRVARGTGGAGAARCAGTLSSAVGPDLDSPAAGRGAAGSQPGVVVGLAPGVPGGGSAGWAVIGIGMTTGPTDGVGMNGVPLSGRAVLPWVAEPALIAARMGIDAVPTSSATVSR